MKFILNGIETEYSEGATYENVCELGSLGVMTGGETHMLSEKIKEGAVVESLSYLTEEGRRIYERTAQLVLTAAWKRVLGDMRMRIENAVGKGVYVRAPHEKLRDYEIDAISREMKNIIDAKLPITREGDIYTLDGVSERLMGVTAPTTEYVYSTEVVPFWFGLALMRPEEISPDVAAPLGQLPKLTEKFMETAYWAEILGCENVSDLNAFIKNKKMREFIRVNEALQAKGLQNIAEKFMERGARVALIAGPSSSGKTTTANRLMIEMRALGLRPVKISVDDYYKDKQCVPLGEDGKPDFERMDILDLEQLNNNILKLLAGETVWEPSYDFKSGKPIPNHHASRVDADQPIIIEGIHALNDEMTYAIPREMKFKIYVSALTTLNIDDHTRIRTTDARLLRRIVRDHQFRGTSPETTLEGWASVRRGEKKYIFPYQENADVMFNTSLVYEMSIMKKYVYPVLCAITPDRECYTTAKRLSDILSHFDDANVDDEVPLNSILREFIGGSCFYRAEE